MQTSTKALLASAAVLILTVVHHFYGAAIYDTPWRRHIAVIVLPVLAVLIAAYGVHRWRPLTFLGRVSMWLFMVLALVIPVAWIGFFEGGYNHVVKNIVFLEACRAPRSSDFFPLRRIHCLTISGLKSPASCSFLSRSAQPIIS